MLGSVLGSAALAIVLDAIWCYFAVSGLVHTGSARSILVFAWAIGTLGIVISDWIWGKPFVHRVRLGVFASAILGIMLIGLDAWTVRHLPSQVHALTWADVPSSLVNRIADAVYNRVAPLFKRFEQEAAPVPHNTTMPASVELKIALITTIHRAREKAGGYMKGGQNDLVAVLRATQHNGKVIRHVRSLQVVGDVEADCGSYIAAFFPDLHGQYSEEYLDNECADKKPFFHLSWISFPRRGDTRIDINDEEFAYFAISQSGGSISINPELFGFRGTHTAPKYPMTYQTWSLLVRFSGVNRIDLTGYGPVLRDELKSGKVKMQANLDDQIMDIAARDIRFPWAVSLSDDAVTKMLPQDLFYGIDNGNREAVPSKTDSLVKPK